MFIKHWSDKRSEGGKTYRWKIWNRFVCTWKIEMLKLAKSAYNFFAGLLDYYKISEAKQMIFCEIRSLLMIFIFCSSSRSIFPPGLVENSNMGEEGLSSFDCANFICYPCMWDYLLTRKHVHIAAQVRIHKYSTAYQVRDTFFHWFYIFILILWEGNKEKSFPSIFDEA